MRKILFLLFMVSSMAAYSQVTNLSTVNTVKPQKGKKMAFEAAYKAHVVKFHKGDEKITVYEILSGPYMGYYHLVEGGKAFASFDKSRPDASAHSLDLDKNFFPILEHTINATYRWMDTLSFHTDVQSDVFVVNVRHIKESAQNDYRRESRRGTLTLEKMKGKFWDNLSVNVFEQLWDGSDPVVVSIRNLKDGFKSLEANYYGTDPVGSPTFKDEYTKAYGTADWDKRVKLLDESVVKNEQYIMRLRKDLSSQ